MTRWPPRFRSAVTALRLECPSIIPVRIRRVRLAGGMYGHARTTSTSPARIIITVATHIRDPGERERRTTVNEQRDTLMHEWAHAIAWTSNARVDHHGPEWGLAMSRVYQAVIED